MARTMVLILVGVVGVIGFAYGVHHLVSSGGSWLGSGDAWVAGEDPATPLVGSAQVRSRGRYVTFTLSLRDAKGRQIRSLRLPNGRRPGPPQVEVLDAEGKRLYQCTLRYG